MGKGMKGKVVLKVMSLILIDIRERTSEQIDRQTDRGRTDGQRWTETETNRQTDRDIRIKK